MKKIRTDLIEPGDIRGVEREWVYNGMDCLVTAEVLEALLPQLDNHTAATYNFSRQLQGPCLEMRLRGVLVDTGRRGAVLEDCVDLLDKLEGQLNQIVNYGFDFWEFNWRSPKDLKELFYNVLEIPPITKDRRVTVDHDALEKLQGYFIASQIARHLLAMRELEKKIAMLRTEIDNDTRFRTSFNIAGTNTGRFSSSFSEFGTGGNLQNVEESLRSVFIADPGYKLAYIDAEQGESRVVGAIEGDAFGDWTYLDACESGDLHTAVSKLCRPDFPWTGEMARDREIAERPYYRHFDLRKLCKSIGHGTNYRGGARTLSRLYKIEVPAIEEFQQLYFKAFPAHVKWHEWTQRTLAREGYIINIMGRKRWFWGRRDDDATLREALAYQGQALADIVNTGMLNVWRNRDALLLAQAHDAILVEYPEKLECEVIPKLLDQLKVMIPLDGDREFIIPYSVATGWNWGKHSTENPDGIKEWTGEDKRKRGKTLSILDRRFRKRYGQS